MAAWRLAAHSGGEPRPMSRYRCAQRGQGVKTASGRIFRVAREELRQEEAVIRGILAGLVSGLALVVVVLAAVSLTSPLPQRPEMPGPVDAPAVPGVEAPAAPAAETAAAEPPAAEPAAPSVDETATAAPTEAAPQAKAEPEAASEPTAAPGQERAPETAPAPILPPPSESAQAAPASVAPEAPLPQGGAPAAPEVAGQDVAGAEGAATPVAPMPAAPPAALTKPAQPAGGAPVLPSTDAAPGARRPEAPAMAEAERADDGPRILPPAPLAPPAATDAAKPEPAPVAEAPADPASRPEPGFNSAVDGVRTGRLPTIAPATEVAPDAPPAGAMSRNARAFANPDNKPPFAILLLDQGGAIADLSTLAASDLPLTLIVDPALPDAAARAALWRAAGQEVALPATALPRRGAAADMEVAMEALSADFPGALAIADLRESSAQGDRAWASALVPALAARGFGMVSMDRGLNAADQVARREGLPAAIIFRELDAKDESAAVIRRYLDRAAFKAQQDGRAIVVGRVRPATITAVLEWALEGRAATLALAPLSAVFPAQ